MRLSANSHILLLIAFTLLTGGCSQSVYSKDGTPYSSLINRKIEPWVIEAVYSKGDNPTSFQLERKYVTAHYAERHGKVYIRIHYDSKQTIPGRIVPTHTIYMIGKPTEKNSIILAGAYNIFNNGRPLRMLMSPAYFNTKVIGDNQYSIRTKLSAYKYIPDYRRFEKYSDIINGITMKKIDYSDLIEMDIPYYKEKISKEFPYYYQHVSPEIQEKFRSQIIPSS